MTQLIIDSLDLSYSDLQRLGWSDALIEDYQGFKRSMIPQSGSAVNPNTIYVANRNGFYVDTATPGYWFNPTNGAITGWIQLI